MSEASSPVDAPTVAELAVSEGIARVVLSSGDGLNRLGAAAMAQVASVAEELAGRDDVRAVLLTSASSHFSVGGDLGAGASLPDDPDAAAEAIRLGPQRAVGAWWGLDVPVVAALRGHAIGLGACLALTADVVIASATTRMRLPHCRFGFVPDGGASWLVPRRTGAGAAGHLLLGGREVDAEDASRLFLVDQVVDDADLDEVSGRTVAAFGAGPTVALRRAKSLLRAAEAHPLPAALEAEAVAFGQIAGTHDFREGLRSFAEARKPRFVGR